MINLAYEKHYKRVGGIIHLCLFLSDRERKRSKSSELEKTNKSTTKFKLLNDKHFKVILIFFDHSINHGESLNVMTNEMVTKFH